MDLTVAVAAGVGEVVDEDLTESVLVAGDGDSGGDVGGDVGGGGAVGEHPDGGVDQFCDVDGAVGEGGCIQIVAGDVDQVPNDAGEVFGLGVDDRDHLDSFGAVEVGVLVEHFGEPVHGGERGAEFVGDGGNQIVALFLDHFSGFADGDPLAGDDQQSDRSGGRLEGGGLLAEFTEGEGKENGDCGVGGDHRPQAAGPVSLLPQPGRSGHQHGRHRVQPVVHQPKCVEAPPVDIGASFDLEHVGDIGYSREERGKSQHEQPTIELILRTPGR